MIVVAYSLRDPAGSGSAKLLLELTRGEETTCAGAVECYSTPMGLIAGYREDVVELEALQELSPAADAFIVMSRHSAESGRKTFSVHHPGNPTETPHGGRPRSLALSFPGLSKALMLNYRETSRGLGGFELTLEATHHGPTEVGRPVVFIEIGSTEAEWRNEEAQKAMALAVLRTLEGGPRSCKAAVGIGGTHYPARFTRMHLEEDVCFGHILARYQMTGVTEDVLRQALERTYPETPQLVFVEKKSVKREQKELIERIAAERGAVVEYL
ncbi:MAG: D-aminoacyl-tRNA deacylase [Acidilobaceae archaeon]|nr:D-aminoacyl-tRNA deacylase [Acidilobaceae archaeon]MCX8165622.1 D-aminoacyl-tRNA deacylase [Acidilobaceae archaeon]MDW7974049.1 D-aminoacyl-tRNA deacylase [Sulfolobales archaeon]